ncbi:hypothetical protein [Acrocarpospora sp. B8E8]|uniref:hypothetical protein n=1 Tax=Acrocarpospora sp. B8E8 TaxID=3153572 RepID=UPI00325FB492
MTIENRRYRVVIERDRPSARFDGIDFLTSTQPRESRDSIAPIRALVELKRFFGTVPYALVGGEFTPDQGGSLVIDLHVSADVEADLQAPATRAGLPMEFARPLLSGLLEQPSGFDVPAGSLRVDRGVYSELSSSPRSFQTTGRLFRAVLGAMAHGADVESAVHQELEN